MTVKNRGTKFVKITKFIENQRSHCQECLVRVEIHSVSRTYGNVIAFEHEILSSYPL